MYLLGIVLTILPLIRGHQDECEVCGNYELTSDPKDPAVDEVRKAMEYSEEIRKGFQSSSITILAHKHGDHYLHEIYIPKLGKVRNEFESGKSFTYKLIDGRAADAVATVDEKERTLEIVFTIQKSNVNVTKLMKYTGKKMSATYNVLDKTATQNYTEVDTTIKEKNEYIVAVEKLFHSSRSKTTSDDDDGGGASSGGGGGGSSGKKGKTRIDLALLPINAQW